MGGLAHEFMSTQELDKVLDNMLTKASPHNPSVDLQRWIHTHRNDAQFKIHQILGAHVAKVSALVPDCFGKFHDPKAAECRMCLDRTLCSAKTRSKQGSDTPALIDIKVAYPLKTLTRDIVSDVLSQKNGQIAKSLLHGNQVKLAIDNNKLRVLSVDATNKIKDKEIIAMGTKGKASAKPVDEELEEELEDEGVDEELEESEEEEEESEDEDEGEEETEDEDEEEAAPAPKAVKAKKEPKPKPVLNKAQQEFQDALTALGSPEEKQKYSQQVIKKLGIAHDNNADPRVAHMQRVMAIKKHLGTVAAPKKAATAAAPAKAAKKATKK